MKLAATEVVMRAFRRAPDGLQWFANLSLSTDAMGMPVVAMNGGRIHIGYYRIDTIPEQVSHLVASYGLTEQIVDELLFYVSDLAAAPVDEDAEDLLAFVISSDAATARTAVIGHRYQLAARQRAAEDQRPHAITRNADEDDIAAHGIETASRGFYSLQKFRYTHRRFDGINSPLLTREILTSGDAVIVLPYDPERGEVVLIEQMRPAALARGSSDAWGLEAVAGLIGYGETPEYTALRELEEEAGLSARALYTLAASYPSPGSLSQYMYSFIAHVDLSGYEAGVFGLASEAEDIRTHVVSLSTARDLLASGEINIMPLQYCLQALLLDKEKIDIEFNGQ